MTIEEPKARRGRPRPAAPTTPDPVEIAMAIAAKGKTPAEAALEVLQTNAALMREQIAYCKRIITRLTERAGDQRSEGAESMRCDAWMEGVHAAWRSLRGDCESAFTLLGCADTDPPVIVVEPTLGQSVVSLLDNALRAGAPVDVALGWNDEEVRIEIRDNGPGFSEDVLRKAGRQTFGEEAQGHGIGLLLASASLDRVGGRLELDNPWTGGARVVIRLPLKRIGVHV
jgi:two-component system sensor histidine kinase RegB